MSKEAAQLTFGLTGTEGSEGSESRARSDTLFSRSTTPELAHDEPKVKEKLSSRQILSVLSSWCIFLNGLGLVLSVGTFQTYYEQDLLKDHSSSDIAWISAICGCLLFFGGMVTGPLYDRGYFRHLLVTGILLEVFGLMMLSLSTEYYQVFLSQGVCVGIASGMMFVPSVASTMAVFEPRQRPKVMGLVTTASSIGGVIYPIVIRRLLSEVGFPWTVRAVAFIVLGTYIAFQGILLLPPTQIGGQARPILDAHALKEVPWVCFSLNAFFGCLAYLLPLFYLPLFAETGLVQSAGPDLAFYTVAIVNGASAPGRLVSGIIGSRVGPAETLTAGCVLSLVVLFAWMAVDSVAGVVLWSVAWGLASSVIVGLPGAIVPLLTPDLAMLGTRQGMYWVAAAAGALVGGPIGGALLGTTGQTLTWWHAQLFAGLAMTIAFLTAIPVVLHVRRLRK